MTNYSQWGSASKIIIIKRTTDNNTAPFTTSIHIHESDGRGEGGEAIDWPCGKLYKIGSASVFLENLTVHEAIGKIAVTNSSNACLICAAILISILQDYWYLNNKKVTKERKRIEKT